MTDLSPIRPEAGQTGNRRTLGIGQTPAGSAEAARHARRCLAATLIASIILTGAASIGPHLPAALAASLVTLAGAAGTAWMASVRRRSGAPPESPSDQPRPAGAWWRRIPRRLAAGVVPALGDLSAVGRTARMPRALITVPLSLAAVAAAALLAPDFAGLPPKTDFLISGALFLGAFPLLVLERGLALPRVTANLPEAAALRALLFALLLCLAGTALFGIVAGAGYPMAAATGDRVLAALPLVIALEVAARATGALFLPPPMPDEAQGTPGSIVAAILAEGAAAGNFAAPVRRHLGLDFARGWALAFVRAALPAITLVVLAIAWGMTGIVLVATDHRAVYERFGQPVRVLPPGLHAILPWPLGSARMVERGTWHVSPLGEADAAQVRFGAEDNPPAAADRLWEQAHPAELTFLIASEANGRQTFQLVSTDIRAVWRIGLSDADALHALYAVDDPAALLRGAAARAVAAFFAGETLPTVLGEARGLVAEHLRDAIQDELNRANTGIELAALSIEAIHPPAGAAEAYHAVQAAEIDATTQISAERGHAEAEAAKAAQYATEIVANAKGRAAETVAVARGAAIQFAADAASSAAGPEVFRLERHLTVLGEALAVAPLTVVDHRIPAGARPWLDARPIPEQTVPAAGAE